MKSCRSKKSGEQGFILLASGMLILVLILFAAVYFSSARNTQQRTELHHKVLSALNAAINSGPDAVGFFEAACNSIKALGFSNSSILACNSSTDFPEIAADPGHRVADYSGVISADGTLICDRVKFDYTPARTELGTPPIQIPPKFCIDVSCQDNALSFLDTSITKIGTSSCIASKPVAAYMAIDFSSSLHAVFQNSYNGSDIVATIPPSFATLGNDTYFSENSISATARYYTQPDSPSCQGCLGLSNSEALHRIVDLQPIGIKDYLLPDGTLSRPISLPFNTKEYDRVGNVLPATAMNINRFVDNPDGLSDNVLRSLPDIVNVACISTGGGSDDDEDDGSGSGSGEGDGCGPDDAPDPIQFVASSMSEGDPGQAMIEPSMRAWWAPPTEQYYTPLNQEVPAEMNFNRLHSLARGGHLVQNALMQRFAGAFLYIYKQAAEQILYFMGSQRVRSGVIGFSNWIIPFVPLYPEQFFQNAAFDEFFGKDITDLKVGGPELSAVPPNPDAGAGTNDYNLLQFGLARDEAIEVTQRISLGARWLEHEVVPGYRPYTALPNPYDSAMPITIDTECEHPDVRYYYPQVFGSDGRCYRSEDISNFPQHMPICSAATIPGYCRHRISDICSDPGTFGGNPSLDTWGDDADVNLTALDPSSGVEENFFSGLFGDQDDFNVGDYIASGTAPTITESMIRWPWRWCRDNPPNVATAIQATLSGAYSKNGEEISQARPAPGTLDRATALNSPNFPRHTGVPSTFTSLAALIATRALSDPYLVSANQEKLLILLFDGAPQNSLLRAQATRGRFGSYIFVDPASPEELPPSYNAEGLNEESVATLETLHILHTFVDHGGKVLLVFLSSGVDQGMKQIFLTALREPNAAPTSDPGVPNNSSYNFCKHSSVPPGVMNLGQQPVSAQTCDPDAEPRPGFIVVDIPKDPSTTYDQYRQQVYQQVILQALPVISNFKVSK